MIWKTITNLKVLNDMAKNTLISHLGIEIVEIGDDYLKATMPVDHRTHQPMGLLHGGASVALSESMGSFASVLILDPTENDNIVGVEINANHHRPVTEGTVYSITKPIKLGRNIQVWNTEIYNSADDKLVCSSRLTTMRVKSH